MNILPLRKTHNPLQGLLLSGCDYLLELPYVKNYYWSNIYFRIEHSFILFFFIYRMLEANDM